MCEEEYTMVSFDYTDLPQWLKYWDEMEKLFALLAKEEDKLYPELAGKESKAKEDLELLSELAKSFGDVVIEESVGMPKTLDPDCIWILIKADDKIIGMVQTELKEDNRFYVSNLIVEPEYRGYGLGTHLLIEAIETAKLNKAESVYLFTLDRNGYSLNFYKQMGFNEYMREGNKVFLSLPL